MRSGAIVLSDAQAAAYQFRVDFQQHYGVIEVTDALIDMAMSLAEKHALRGYDSVHLAAALSLQQVRASLSLPTLIFVSADNRLNAIAQAESLPVENPNEKD
jgi:uncharacterized protein